MVYPFIERFKNGLVPQTHKKALPVGTKRPETLAEQVARLVRHSEFARQVAAAGYETFEEADDFDIPDDPVDLTTPYERDFDLAAAAASERGVVAKPDPALVAKSMTVLEKAKNAVSKRKSPPAGGTPAESAGDPVAPNNAQGDAAE